MEAWSVLRVATDACYNRRQRFHPPATIGAYRVQLVREFWSGIFVGAVGGSITCAAASLTGSLSMAAIAPIVAGVGIVGFLFGAAAAHLWQTENRTAWFRDFLGIDLRALAVFRMALGSLLLVDLAIRATHVVAHYSDGGVLPRSILAHHPSHWTLHLLSGETSIQLLLFAIAAAVAVTLLLGCCTRIATIASWFLLMSVQARNPLTSDAGQDLFRLLLFWSMFLPLGARWSIDQLLLIKRTRRLTPYVSLAGFALMAQICFLYGFAYLYKTDPAWRLDGSAVYYALSIDMLTTPLGQALLDAPRLLRGLTFGVVTLEMAMPFLVFCPWRTAWFRMASVIAFWGMHFGFWLCMKIELFPFICIAAWIIFVPRGFWDWFARPCLSCRSLIRGPLVRKAPQVWCRLGLLLRYQVRRRPWLIKPFSFFAAGLPLREGIPQPARHIARFATTLFVGLCLVYVLLYNLKPIWSDGSLHVLGHRVEVMKEFTKPRTRTIAGKRRRIDPYTLGRQLRLDQRWSMFTRVPLLRDGFFVMPGVRKDGSTVDVWHGGDVVWTKPERVSETFRSYRWYKYLEKFHGRKVKQRRRYYADFCRYLGQQWNTSHAIDDQVESIEVWFVVEQTRHPYAPRTYERVRILGCSCKP